MNIHLPPPPPINVLATALEAVLIILTDLSNAINQLLMTPFVFKLTAKLLLELENSHVYSQQGVVTVVRKKSPMQISAVLLLFA